MKNRFFKNLTNLFLALALLALGLTAQAEPAALTAEGYVLRKTAQTLTLRIPETGETAEFAVPEAMLEQADWNQVFTGGRARVAYEEDGQGRRKLTAIVPAAFEVVEGVIQEVREDGILIAPYEGVEVLARLPEGAIADGLTTLLPGMPVRVTYDGVMTRSIPAQITAEAVVVPVLTGVVVSAEEGRFVLEQDDGLGQVIVHLGEDSVVPEGFELAEGSRLQAVFSGIMALSMPPQAGALFILPLPAGE
jgi:hypothetical protein